MSETETETAAATLIITPRAIITTTSMSKGRRRSVRQDVTRLATHLAIVVAAIATTSISINTRTTSAFPIVSFETRETGRRQQQQQRQRRLEMVASPIELEITKVTTSATATGAITMDDVVASASLELQKQKHQQEHQRQQHQQQQQEPGTYKTPFEWFEDHDKARIVESEQVGLDRLRINEDEDEIGGNGGAWGGTIDPSEIVSWSDLKALVGRGRGRGVVDSAESASPSASAPESNVDPDRLRELYRAFEDAGGFLVVRLDDDEDASTVADMWTTMEAYYSLPPDQQQVDRQTLEKDDGSHDPEAGYHFQQTYMNIDGEILPETIQNALKQNAHPKNPNQGDNDDDFSDSSNNDTYTRGIEGSHKLFADITKTVGTIVAAGALEKDLELMDKVATSMLDDRKGHPYVNAEHRLSKYVIGQKITDTKMETKTKAKAKESLISHTDWTFATCIPLSAIPGLQVWKPLRREWIVPEAILGGNSNSDGNENKIEDRTRYVVVMAGKWIELLTNCRITSCVHRVVTQPALEPKARLSAPFFGRPKRAVFELFQDEFNESWNNELASQSQAQAQEQAIERMGRLFGDWIRFVEGDRDPSIPDCILDLCVDREDKAPGCFSIEDVLGNE